jgi:ABC-type phosphate transport system substrate-binding protein
MRFNLSKPLMLAGALLVVSTAWAGDVFVIANSGLNLTAEEVRDVFTGEKQLAGSVKFTPMDNSSAQADFLSKVVKVEATKYTSIWVKKGFRDGLNPPPMRSSDAEVINAVKSSPGGVGYVSKATPDVKVIHKY